MRVIRFQKKTTIGKSSYYGAGGKEKAQILERQKVMSC